MRSFYAVRRYWSVLEVPFYSLINDLAFSNLNGLGREEKMMQSWAEITVRCAAEDSLNEQIGGINDEARNLRAAVLARRTFALASARNVEGH